jgi:hypothetical protein
MTQRKRESSDQENDHQAVIRLPLFSFFMRGCASEDQKNTVLQVSKAALTGEVRSFLGFVLSNKNGQDVVTDTWTKKNDCSGSFFYCRFLGLCNLFLGPDQLVSLEFKRVHWVNPHTCRKYGCISIHRGYDR